MGVNGVNSISLSLSISLLKIIIVAATICDDDDDDDYYYCIYSSRENA